MQFEVWLLQQATKNQQKSMKNRMFFETSIQLKPPRGGAPPPTHSWRTCARGLVLAGVLGVLGFLGILLKDCEKIVPKLYQIEFWGSQIEPRASVIEPGAVQDAQKPAKSDNKRGKKRQECPKSARERPSAQKSANITPTWSPGKWEN